MKKIRQMGFACMAMFGSLAAQSDSMQKQMISLSDLSDETINQDFSRKASDYVVECREGTLLPLNMTAKGEFLGLESATMPPLYVKVLKTCYVQYEEEGRFLFSDDLQNWQEFTEFFTGQLQVSFKKENGGPVAELLLELNRKTP